MRWFYLLSSASKPELSKYLINQWRFTVCHPSSPCWNIYTSEGQGLYSHIPRTLKRHLKNILPSWFWFSLQIFYINHINTATSKCQKGRIYRVGIDAKHLFSDVSILYCIVKKQLRAFPFLNVTSVLPLPIHPHGLISSMNSLAPSWFSGVLMPAQIIPLTKFAPDPLWKSYPSPTSPFKWSHLYHSTNIY